MTDTKAFGQFDVDIKALEPDETNGVTAGMFEAILSAPTLDRDGEIIDAKAFDPLPDHITIDIDHGMSVGTTVGSGVPFYDGDILKFRGSFSSIPRAQEVRTLVTEGHIRKMSVAFMNANRETDPDDERPHIRRAELLNAAIVPIPSNREASILAAKALAAEKWAVPAEPVATARWVVEPWNSSSSYTLDVVTLADARSLATAEDPETPPPPAAATPALTRVDGKTLAAFYEAQTLT